MQKILLAVLLLTAITIHATATRKSADIVLQSMLEDNANHHDDLLELMQE